MKMPHLEFMPLYTTEQAQNSVFNDIFKMYQNVFEDLENAYTQVKMCKCRFSDEQDYHLATSGKIFKPLADIKRMYVARGIGFDADNIDTWLRFKQDVGVVANYILANKEFLSNFEWKK